jgi:hypothetical protein
LRAEEYKEHYFKRSDPEALPYIVEGLEAENSKLREKLWKLQNRGTFPAGLVLASSGGVCLLFSYLLSSEFLTFIGLGLTLWGTLIFYISKSENVPKKVIDALPLSMLKSIDMIIGEMSVRGRPIFVQLSDGADSTRGFIFVPGEEGQKIIPSSINQNKVFQEDPKGILIACPNEGLMELFEKELKVSFGIVNLTFIQQKLPNLLIEDLRLVDSFLLEEKDNNMIAIQFSGRSSVRLCNLVSEKTKIGSFIGCPLCGAIALAISKTTNKPVYIKETVSENGDSIRTVFQVEDVKQA